MGKPHRSADREVGGLVAPAHPSDRNPLNAMAVPPASGRFPIARGPSVARALSYSLLKGRVLGPASGALFGVVEYERERAQMVLDLMRMGIRDERVIAAMARVPRE